MNLHAYVTADEVKPAGEFTNDKGAKVSYKEKRVLTLLEINSNPQDGVKHLMEMRIDVNDKVAGPGANITGMVGDFVIHEIRPGGRDNAGEVGIVGTVVRLTGQIAEKAIDGKKAA